MKASSVLIPCAVWVWRNGTGRGSGQSVRGIPTVPPGNGLRCVLFCCCKIIVRHEHRL